MSDGKNARDLVALSDSGAEICLAHSSAINDLFAPKIGEIKVRGIIGESIVADLIRLNVAMANNVTDCIPVNIAVLDQVNEHLMLTAEVVDCLIGKSMQKTHADVLVSRFRRLSRR